MARASLDKLRSEWRRLYRCEPPKISRDLLIRGIVYRRQELKHGGLGKTTRRKLKTLAKMFRTTGRVAPDPGLALKPGARLVREWHGRTHTVTVTQQKRLVARGRQVSEEFPTLAPDAARSILMTLVNRVDIKAEHVEIRVYLQRLHDLLQAQSIETPLPAPAPAGPGYIVKLKVKARLQRVGREMKLVVHNADDRAAADPGLLRIVTRAHDFQERLMQNPDLTVPAIASQERLSLARCGFLRWHPISSQRSLTANTRPSSAPNG